MSFFKKLFGGKKAAGGVPADQQVIALPGGSVRVPKKYRIDHDEEGTTILELPGCSTVLRISMLFMEPKDKSKPAQLNDHVRQQAAEKGIGVEEHLDGKTSYSYDETGEEGDAKLVIRYWMVGVGNCLAIFSATMLANEVSAAATRGMLADVPGLIESLELAHRQEFIETEHGVVPTTVTAIPEENAPKQTRRAFGEGERRTLAGNLRMADGLRTTYGVPRNGATSPDELDLIFSRWIQDGSSTKPGADAIATSLGSAFGEILGADFQMHWEVLTDEYGTAWAMAHVSTITSFPIESVRKRIEDGTHEFFRPIYETVKAHINDPECRRS